MSQPLPAAFERGRRLGRLLRSAWLPVAAVLGALVGVALAPAAVGDVGPLTMSAVVRPDPSPDTTIRLAPLGSIQLDTHAGPVGFDLRLEELRLDEAQAVAEDPSSLDGIQDELAADARALLLGAARRAALFGVGGALVGAFLARRRWRSLATGAAVAGLLVGGTGLAARATFDPDALGEPRYSGLLALAPAAVGDVEEVIERFGEYRAQLTDLVANAVTLYRAGRSLPDLDPGREVIRLLHVADIHNNPQAFDLIQRLVDDFKINAVIDAGDISDWGTGAETRLTQPIADLAVPYVFVRGNHDSADTEAAIAALPNAVVLDGDSSEVAGLRIWGIGDPRFTPDKSQETGVDVEREAIKEFAPLVRREVLRDRGAGIDIALMHDPRAAAEIDGLVPLVLAGHFHATRVERQGSTLVLVEASTGGAGLRNLQGEFPQPLTASILYVDREEQRLVAYDRISVAGLGGSGASIEREIVPIPGSEEDQEATRDRSSARLRTSD